jgi:MOB kinase activator 1
MAAEGAAGPATSQNRKAGTIRTGTLLPPRQFPPESRYQEFLIHKQKSLGSQELVDEVRLPKGCGEEEWLAISTVEFFNELNLLVGAVQEICTDASCPMMTAGSFTYAWADGDQVKQPTNLSAPKYFEALLTWVDKQLSDEKFLPVKPGVPFPENFRKGVRTIYKRLFRIYAHIFHSHYKAMMEDEADAHLNHSFKHFVYFVKEFDLVDDAELEPMKDLVAKLMDQKRSMEKK